MIRSTFSFASAFAVAALMMQSSFAQETKAHDHEHAGAHAAMPTLGVAVIQPTAGGKVRGMLRLMQKGENLQVMGKIRNLTPGDHGFHIHEFGDMRNMKDGTSAGGHFNPSGVPHGAPGHGHVGDLGNITANAEGEATVDVTLEHTMLHFILGRSFVVHAGKDDLTSQPSGDAGPRVGVGIIGAGNPEYKAAGK
ncbi:superoxide dismutase family protein [Rubripirellula reticaptiva]|uniref:Superoxide dismutase [Cu-Zn] n=1 Tax=Rubripirellula reticaptiva TaxID=2528013 RepID=A0A5C6EPY9_9BACT|nr:superoxide dismutase family protein [Rubripirellula reticaptiva]TWU51833.1 Superoxide dismutase [Cu-Zn] precursor [Rubripirellula reticaptiva]